MKLESGFAFLPEPHILVADPSYGVSMLKVGTGLEITEEAHTVVNGSVTLCLGRV